MASDLVIPELSDISDQSEQAPSPRRSRNHGKLERGWVKIRLLQELAAEEKTQRMLAQEFSCAASSIAEFKERHLDEIATIRRDMANELRGLWIAEKINRLAEYQQDVEDLNAMLENTPLPDAMRLKMLNLKAVAEEMGHLPAKTAINVEGASVVYRISPSVDLDQLQ